MGQPTDPFGIAPDSDTSPKATFNASLTSTDSHSVNKLVYKWAAQRVDEKNIYRYIGLGDSPAHGVVEPPSSSAHGVAEPLSSSAHGVVEPPSSYPHGAVEPPSSSAHGVIEPPSTKPLAAASGTAEKHGPTSHLIPAAVPD